MGRTLRVDRSPALLLGSIVLFSCGGSVGLRDGGADARADAAGTGGKSGAGGLARASGGEGGATAGSGGAAGEGGAHSRGGGSGAGGLPGSGGGAGAMGGGGATAGAGGGGGTQIGSGGTPGSGGAANTGTGGLGTGGLGTGGLGTGGGAVLYTVAHPDDELLFINPDLETDIQAGRRIRIVYVTSGDLTGSYPDREAGVMSAGAAMAGVDDTWACATAMYAGKALRSCTLVELSSVTYQFMRVGDGQVMNVFTGGTATTADSSSTYDATQLAAVLTAIQAEYQPARVGTLDGTLAYGGGDEHPDHVATAFFTFDVARSDGAVRQLAMYRGYTMYADPPPPAPMPANLSPTQHDEKARLMGIYGGAPLDVGEIYDEWCWRFYPIPSTPGGPGPFKSALGACLEPLGSADGSGLELTTCDGSAGQLWTVTGDGRAVGSGGKCLGVADDGFTADIETCDRSADQQWTLLSNGQLRGTRDQCLTNYYSYVQSQLCQSDATDDDPPYYNPPVDQQWTF